MPQILTPSGNLAFPTQRTELSRISIMASGHGYLIEGEEMVQIQADGDAVTCDAIVHKPSPETTRLLILFLGGIGDTICLRTCLDQPVLREVFPKLEEVAIASFLEDRLILGDSIQGLPLTVYDYPVSEEIAWAYDGVISYGVLQRQSIKQSLWDTYASPLGLPLPTGPKRLPLNPQVQRAVANFLHEGKKQIGIQMTSPSIYKSWHQAKGYEVALALANAGYAVYLLGGPGQRLEMTDDHGYTEPHGGIFDLGGILRNVGEIAAFVSLLDGVISIDSGIMHMAGALGVPCVALFSLTDGPSRCGLYPTVHPIEAAKGCSPCWHVAEYPDCGERYCTALAEIPGQEILVKLLASIE